MVKRALCIGCNYPSKAFGLAGAVNDAFLIAECLQRHCGFDQENVCILHDVIPGQKKSMKVEPSKAPTRVNIMKELQSLVRSARPGDVLFFSFSGYGLQVDDMDGYQDEGFDEAILPTDFVDGRDGDYTVIVADDIHDILMGIPSNCSATVVMDCDHATSIVDVSGTIDGRLVSGLKFNNFCGLKAHTAKMVLANHNRDVWQEERARAVKARPRFQPMMEIDNPRKGRLPTRPAMSRSTPVAFCYSAAGHGQTAMEMQMTAVVDGKEQPRQHGVLSWSFVKALEEMSFECTHSELMQAIRRQISTIREKDLPRIDQDVLLTFSTPLSNPTRMRVLQSVNEADKNVERATFVSGFGGYEEPAQARVLQPVVQPAAPPVVPPPPPGTIKPQPELSGRHGRGCGLGPGATPDRGEHQPLLPPPPPQAADKPRCSSELIHHDVASVGGASFACKGASWAPPHLPRPPQDRPPSIGNVDGSSFGRQQASSYMPPPTQPQFQPQVGNSFGGNSFGSLVPQHAGIASREPSRDMQLTRQPLSASRQPSGDFSLVGGSPWMSASLQTQPQTTPQLAPGAQSPFVKGFAGLTPPNLFAQTPTPLSFSHGYNQGGVGRPAPGQFSGGAVGMPVPAQPLFAGGGLLRR